MSGRLARLAPGSCILVAAFFAAALLLSAPAAFADTAAAPQTPAPTLQGKASQDAAGPDSKGAALPSAGSGAAAPAAQASKKPSDSKPADLKEARSRLAAAASPAEYAAMLDSFSTSLPPSDAIALLDQGVAGAAEEYRRALLVKAADLDLLLGLFGEAAERYQAAAGSPTAGAAPTAAKEAILLLRAARCSIAAGDAEKAQALAADIITGAEEPDLLAAARLVDAWALLMQERSDDASALASAIAGAAKGSPAYPGLERRREARFLLWLCAGAEGKASAAAKLASEFPGSPEALIAAGSASAPPLPHWYLGGLGAARTIPAPRGASPAPALPAVPSSAGPASSSSQASPQNASGLPPPSASAAAALPSTKGKRLQVGYFSREDNAQALKAELAGKGFAALVEARIRAAGQGKAEEKRWIVVVDGGKDLPATLQSLKDAGYESYVID